MRTRCARCRKLGHRARECPEGNRGQGNDERYDRRAWRFGENPKGFIAAAGHTERRPLFLGASWTFVALDPGEVLWDTGTQEGIVGEQHLNQWCKLLAEYGLQVEWSQEQPEFASGIGGATRPIGVVYVPVGLAGCNGIIRFTVVEQDVSPLLPVGVMRTLQASLDLHNNSDKVILRQFGGESSLRTLKSGHTAIRADQFDLDGWQLPDSGELCQNDDQGSVTNYKSATAHLHKRPRCTTDNRPPGDTDAASTRSYIPPQKISSHNHGTARPHPTNTSTSPSRFKSEETNERYFAET